MIAQQSIDVAAQNLRTAIQDQKACTPVSELIGKTDLAMAYAVQSQNTRWNIAQGKRLVGRKIGLTSKAVQKQLGVDQPDYGILFNDMEVMMGDVIPWKEVIQPKVEAEIAFVLAKDLLSENIGIADVLSAIEYVVASIEVVDSRIEDWNICITDTIADNASSSHFILGHKPVHLGNVDLIDCKMALYQNGEKVSEGNGAACMGSPINATLWLAKTMVRMGTPLKAGEIILSGACGPMAVANPGDHFKASIEGLGSVSVSFGEKTEK